MAAITAGQNNAGKEVFKDKDKPTLIRNSNITAAKCSLSLIMTVHYHYTYLCTVAVADAIRTSLGPRGMDKMVI